MSKGYILSFGEYIKELRERNNLPLRKIAAELNIDVSTLCKIEKNQRRANEIIIKKLARIFDIDQNQLRLRYFSDSITAQILDHRLEIEVLKIVAKKFKYLKKNETK